MWTSVISLHTCENELETVCEENVCVCVCVCVLECQPTALLRASGSMQGG